MLIVTLYKIRCIGRDALACIDTEMMLLTVHVCSLCFLLAEDIAIDLEGEFIRVDCNPIPCAYKELLIPNELAHLLPACLLLCVCMADLLLM